MANKFSPKRQAIKDMIEAGLKTALLVGEKVILANGQLSVIKQGRIYEVR